MPAIDERTQRLFRHVMVPADGTPSAAIAHPLMPLITAYRQGSPSVPPQQPVVSASDTQRPATLQPIDLVARIQQVSQLPALPEAVIEVMQALNREEISASRCIALISQDQALAARTLRLANSAFYGLAGRVGSIGDAVRLLGLRTISGVLTAAALCDSLCLDACPEFNHRHYWRHAIGSALAARALAPHAGCDADMAFLAGLMHDVGQLVLAACMPVEAGQAIAWAHRHDGTCESAEQSVIGIDHAQIGAVITAKWRFPERIVQAIADHHAVAPELQQHGLSLRDLIQVADAVAHALDLNADPSESVPPVDPRVWHLLALGPTEAIALFRSVESGALEMCELLSVA